MSQKILMQLVYENVTIDEAKQTPSIFSPKADHIAYVVVASSASSPTGTTIQIQGSIDGVNWVSLGSAVSVTGNGTFGVSLGSENANFNFYRLAYAHSSGSYVASTTALTKGKEV